METDWIRRLKQDDETALCEIIRKYTGYVYTILRNFSTAPCRRRTWRN